MSSDYAGWSDVRARAVTPTRAVPGSRRKARPQRASVARPMCVVTSSRESRLTKISPPFIGNSALPARPAVRTLSARQNRQLPTGGHTP